MIRDKYHAFIKEIIEKWVSLSTIGRACMGGGGHVHGVSTLGLKGLFVQKGGTTERLVNGVFLLIFCTDAFILWNLES